MKKLFASLLAFMLFISPALAEDIDLSSLSLDDLTLLQQRVSAEIASKIPDAGDPLPEGMYTVGEDLKPGKYILTITHVKRDSVGASYGQLCVRDDSGSLGFYNYNIEPGECMFFSFREGMSLEVYFCSGILSPATQSWVAD